MRLLVLLLIGGIGAALAAWGLHRGGRSARGGALVGVLALVGVTIAAFLLRPGRIAVTGEPVTGIFDAHLAATAYLRLIVGLWGLESLVLVLVAWLLGGLVRLRGLLPATLAAMTGGTVALASADLAVGLAAGAATGVASLIVVLHAEGSAAVAAAARELRVSLVGGAVLLACLAIVPVAGRIARFAAGVAEGPGGASPVGTAAIGLVAVATTLAVAARWGMLPFHIRVSRLADIVPPEALPLLLAWIAVPITVVAIAMVDRLLTPLALPLDGERTLLVLFALVTLVGAAIAAFFNDDLRHAMGYVIVAESGLLVLAIAAMEPAAWGAGRTWVVVLAASKTALGAWAAVTEDRFGTRSVPDLRGWIRRSPFLAAALALTALATVGLPGWIAFEARQSLTSLAAGAPWDALVLIAALGTLPVYVRLLVVGAGQPTSRVDRAAPEWVAPPGRTWKLPKISGRSPKVEQLVVTQEGSDELPAEGVVVPEAAGPTRRSRAKAAPAAKGAASPVAVAKAESAASSPASPEAIGEIPTEPVAPARRPRAAGPGLVERIGAAGHRVVVAARRDKTQLLSGAVLALAILAVLTSWGALDLGNAAAEPAPIPAISGTD